MAGLLSRKKQEAQTTETVSKVSKKTLIIKDEIFHANLSRIAEINEQLTNLQTEYGILSGEVKKISIEKFCELVKTGETGSFSVEAHSETGKKVGYMFIPTDNYIKITKEDAILLEKELGKDITEENTSYELDEEMVNKYGEEIEKMLETMNIPEEDKEKLLKVKVTKRVKKGTIKNLSKYGEDIFRTVELCKPIFQTKNVHVIE